jgi:hypothetical protein
MQRVDWKSTLLEDADYQDPLALLEVAFRSGAIYHYFAVPAQTYQELLQAKSKGGYFNSHIRNRFSYAKIQPAGRQAVRNSQPNPGHKQ